MNRFLISFLLILIGACASQKATNTTGHTRTKPVQYLDRNTFFLTEVSDDETYAFTPKNPVKVGSDDGGGPLNERRFLNALLGPNGEHVEYYRAGSCCPFKTPNGLLDNTGLLDRYRVSWQGAKDTLDIYINMYDKGDLKIPVGFRAKSKN